jgi:RNA polymerase sigma-70 factor (ECF subfamily)
MPLRAARPGPTDGPGPDVEELLRRVARGDTPAFETLYDRVVGTVYGVIRRVLRDPAQSEEVTQEVMVEVWRTATRFDRTRGSASTWIHTWAHRGAFAGVRSSPTAQARDERIGRRDQVAPYDVVVDQVEARLEQERVRRCLEGLTELQRQSVTLAYYGGYTYREVAEVLDTPLGTVKTRLRDGLIRMRDCLGVTA